MNGSPGFGAFISYKRTDEAFALRLEQALERYSPPRDLPLPHGHLNVFRDKEDLTGPEYNAAIEKYLGQSAKLIVLCSPQARASSYVNDEIRRFARARGAANIIPVLVSGLPNNEARPDQEDLKAFPEALCEAMAMPLAVDYRGFDVARDRIERGAFEGAWYSLLANIYDINRGDLEQRDKKRQARARRIRMQIVAGVVVVLAALTVWALLSRQQAISRQLAANAIALLNVDPEQSLELSVRAVEASRTAEAEESLRRALMRPRLAAVFREHTGWVNDATFSPSGRLILTASADTTSRVVDASTGQTLHVLSHPAAVAQAVFSPADEATVLTVADGTARIWRDGVLTTEAPGTTAAFSPDGTRVASTTAEGIRVWEAHTGRLVWEHRSNPPPCVSFSPDGASVLICIDDAAELWRIGGARAVKTFAHGARVQYAEFSVEGSLVVTAGDSTTARVWETGTTKSWMLAEHERNVTWAGFSHDAERTVVTISGKTARVWTTETEVQTRGHTDTVFHARFSPDGTKVVTASADHTVRIWEVPRVVVFNGHRDWVTQAAFNRYGRRVVTASWDHSAKVWDAASGAVVADIDPGNGEGLNSAALSPDGVSVATAGVWPVPSVHAVDAPARATMLTGHTSEVFTIDYSPDGSRIVTAGGQDGTVRIWNAASGAEEMTLRHGEIATSARFSPDGRFVVTTGTDQIARIVNLETKAATELRGHTGIVWRAAFSPDGSLVATASGDMTARLWDTRTGQQLAVLRGHTARLADVGFHPQGRLVITASADKTARVWDARSGRVIAVVEHHSDLVSSASFSPDGTRVLTSSDDKTAKNVECALCDASLDDLLGQARDRMAH